MPLMPQLHARSHGQCRATFEGEPTLLRTIGTAVGFFAVLATGVALIVHGLI